MADLKKIKLVDCEVSTRTRNALTNYYTTDVTLQTLADVDPDHLKKVHRLGARGILELQEVIDHFRDMPPERVAIATSAIKKVTMYQAPDGTAFPTMAEAARYAARCEFRTWCEEHLGGYISSDEAGSMTDAILDAWLVERRQ